MTKEEFVKLMQFPREWLEWDMLPDELLQGQIAEYESGSERAAEHYRNAAFRYWLRRQPSKEVLLKLARLTFLDPDPLMAYCLRKDDIASATSADEEVVRALRHHRI